MLAISKPLCIPVTIQLSEDPAQEIQLQFPGKTKATARFRRTAFAALPSGCLSSESKVVAHFRENVDQWARHLVVLENNCIMVLCVDEYNPDRGHVQLYQKQDVERPPAYIEGYDGMTPIKGQPMNETKSLPLQKVAGTIAVRRPTGIPNSRGRVVVKRGPRLDIFQVVGANKIAGKKAMLQFLANCQQDLSLQAILHFICAQLEDDAKTYSPSEGEEFLLEEVKNLQWSQEKIEATQNNELHYLKEIGDNIRTYYLLLRDMKDDLQKKVEDDPSDANQLAFMAVDELISMQERAGGDKIVPVAFTVPYVNEVIEDWLIDVADVFDIDEDDLDRPQLG